MTTDPPDLVELYLRQRWSLAQIGARYGHTAVLAPGWALRAHRCFAPVR